MTSDPDTAEVDRHYRAWLRSCLDQAADHFRLTITGVSVFGWRLRSISAPVHGPDGARWLRVVTEEHQWLPADFWTGNSDANIFTDLAKPHVLDVTEWDEPRWRRRVRAEIMTVLPGEPCSPTDVLYTPITLPNRWWAELHRTLAVIHSTLTTRVNADQDKVTQRVRAVFGPQIDLPVDQWETVHGDLHWANLLQPFGLLDWELWGQGPAHTDAATLYCFSLLAPQTASTVWDAFPALATRAGRTALIYVAARLLHRVRMGDHPELALPLRQLADDLTA
ncbi:aminoglycoside phosphotransferase [Saccharopolyspora sp. K220]|uniref:aminoglycoside phosphotransferase n=1 Tax=Saccharopolyspora soli TaxID=2926618 RepID=UPI001F56577D|nr:aminoglycoside phosphotransferase [Saccharopolyspora soli]MCI2424025.1 aminoglycoside phosphotransferase [Saccharopolyspora soli]